jgi:hypothetical protein
MSSWTSEFHAVYADAEHATPSFDDVADTTSISFENADALSNSRFSVHYAVHVPNHQFQWVYHYLQRWVLCNGSSSGYRNADASS